LSGSPTEKQKKQQKRTAMQKKSTTASAIYILMISLLPSLLRSQVVVGAGTPDGSALLEIQSGIGGVLLPRMTQAQRDAITSPATGLILYNTSSSCLEINVGTPTLPEWARLQCLPGSISTLDCAGATVTGSLLLNQAASGVSASVPCTGGNGGVHEGQVVSSTGVTGLTATLSAGNFGSGAGSLSYAITGTPASGGTASFALNIGGQTCTLDVTVSSAPVCRAKVTATDYKNFMCYNLGAANTSADPFSPTWEINGGYWQWGQLAQATAGPTGPDAGQANDGPVSGWNTTNAANGSWADGSKTANDPCLVGYRVPTKAEWDGVVANNTKTNVGSFNNSATNYGAGVKFGDQLMLPAAGGRNYDGGALLNRGDDGYYWSSTEFGNSGARYLNFSSSGAGTYYYYRTYGLSVRCVAE
jgi:uncharacterized protein (TIGR02145 family)